MWNSAMRFCTSRRSRFRPVTSSSVSDGGNSDLQDRGAGSCVARPGLLAYPSQRVRLAFQKSMQ